ncbi:MAG TPA: type II toxin-antitoxin system prevent-host-death family antitoxin [Rhizomicrobium sp.]|nr:type II toxin-antitoxin system prevent-host-death family antitoxin [Rhizomicrobium sp.]
MTAEPKKVNFREFRTNLSTYLREVHDGAEIVVTSHGKEVARVVPPASIAEQRAKLFGMFKGQLHMAADFDETPPEWIDEMEAGGA